jgi:hypothetical protein
MIINAVLNEVGALPDRLMNFAFRAERKTRNTTRQHYLDELMFYEQPKFRDEKAFFVLPDSPPEFDTLSCNPFHDGEALLLKYPSRYQPHNPRVASRFFDHTKNSTGYLWLWRHPRPRPDAPQRPLVLCVHGFRMGHPDRAMAMFKVEKLFMQGMDVALFIQPHHWKRSSSKYRQHFFNAEDVPLTIENVGQQIHDLHSCYLGLQGMGYSRIGLIGGSLGGMAVTLYATLSNAPAFIFSVVPAIRVDTHLDPVKSKLPFAIDDNLRQHTFRALDLIDPTFYSPRMDLQHFAVVYHQGDKINDAQPTRAWAQAWKLPHVTALPGGHWLVFDGKARGRAWYGWLKTHGFCQ